MVIFTDTHTHLYAEEFSADIDFLLQTAMDKGILRFFMPNIDSGSIRPMLELREKYPDHCFPMMGLHPCSVHADYLAELKKTEDQLSRNTFYAIGEIGLDMYWDKTHIREQKQALEKQLDWAVELKLPVVIHSRDSFDMIADLMEDRNEIPNGVFHCFSGTPEMARRALKLGFYLGIGGVVTFKNGGLDKILPELGIEKLVLETDAPYLSPVPHRGKRNEPAYLELVAIKMAEILGISLEEVAEKTTANSKLIFKI
jgi:TatD DNase family protein